ncbi:MAG: GNAT family N-acetyltransferase [Tumebacillaceae bacterium]
MIRKLTQQDHEQLFDYLKADASFNLFIIGDLEVFGYENEIQDTWGEFDEADQLRGVLFRFYHTYMPYSIAEFDVEAFAKIIAEDEQFDMLQGRSDLVDRFAPYLGDRLKAPRDLYFAELKDGEQLDPQLDVSDVKLATLDDVDRIIGLREQISEFETKKNARETLLKVMEGGMARTFYIEADGRMICTASTTAENSLSAMVVGVASLSEYRGQGLATRAMTVLCQQLLAEGRLLCLFYDNPKAGEIYKRLGFRDIGMWRMQAAK